MPFKVTRQGHKLVIEVPLFRKPMKSKTDPSKILIAGTRGEMPTEVTSHGSNLIVSVSAFIRPRVPEEKIRAKITMLKLKGRLI